MKPCFECGQPADHEHHVVPRSRGGTKTVPLCTAHHDATHDTKLLTLAEEGHFGYRLEAGLEIPDPAEYPVVELVVAMNASGTHANAIAEYLSLHGIQHRTADKTWQANQIYRILDRAGEVPVRVRAAPKPRAPKTEAEVVPKPASPSPKQKPKADKPEPPRKKPTRKHRFSVEPLPLKQTPRLKKTREELLQAIEDRRAALDAKQERQRR